MSDALPIQVTSIGLFEPNDKASAFLIQKLEAWLNFQALAAEWFSDESHIVKFKFQIMPETEFYQHQLPQELNWQTLSLPTVTGVFHHNTNTMHFDTYLMLSNSEINEMMDAPSKVEEKLQTLLKTTMNWQGAHYKLAKV